MASTPHLLDRLWRTFISGLVTVIPILVTVYLLVWASLTAERFFRPIVTLVLPEAWYLPGLGIAVAVVFVLLVGAFLQAWLFERLVGLGDRLLERIPLVKTIYTGVRDLLQFLSSSREEDGIRQVALVRVQEDIHVIGFVTDDRPQRALPELATEAGDDAELVSVYLPMGYQIGGYTLYLPRDRIRPLDLSIEEAMRLVLTAGVNRPARRGG